MSVAALLILLAGAGPAGAAGPLGPEGGTIAAVAAIPDGTGTRIFVGHRYLSGLLTSTDPAAGWAVTAKLPYPADQVLAAPSAPSTLYARAGGRVFRSTDGGAHWTQISSFLTSGIAVAPSDANTVGAISSYTPGPVGPVPIVYITRDGGAHWGGFDDLFAGSPVSLAFDPNDPGVAWAATPYELYQLDGGYRSRPIFPVALATLRIDPAPPTTFWAGGRGGLAQSLDRGVTWTVLPTLPVGAAESVDLLVLDPAHPGTLYAGVNPLPPAGGTLPCPPPRARLARTTDGGATWTVAAPPAAHLYDLTLDPRLPGTLYAASDNGFLVSADDGATWTRENHGLLAREIAAVAIDPFSPGTLWAADDAPTFSRGLFASRDGGATWTLAQRCLPPVTRLLPDPRQRGRLYALTTGGLFATADAGAHWSGVAPAPGGQILDLAIDPRNPALLYAASRLPREGGGTGYALVKSADRGATWSSLSGAPRSASYTRVALDPSRPSTVFACGGHQVHRLYGSRFVPVSDLPLDGDDCLRLVVAPGNRDLYALGQYGDFAASHDHGGSWQRTRNGLPPVLANDLAPGLDPATVYLATPVGIFVTHDRAATWKPFAQSTPTISPLAVDSLFVDPRGTLAAGVGGGMFTLRIGGR